MRVKDMKSPMAESENFKAEKKSARMRERVP
jgi:hypothetical protein